MRLIGAPVQIPTRDSRSDPFGGRRQDRPLLLDVRPHILLYEDHSEVRGFAATQNALTDTFLAADVTHKGMAEMSEKFCERGGEIYVPAAE